jgi:hypothetical protein
MPNEKIVEAKDVMPEELWECFKERKATSSIGKLLSRFVNEGRLPLARCSGAAAFNSARHNQYFITHDLGKN